MVMRSFVVIAMLAAVGMTLGFDVRAWLLAGMAINPKHLLEP